MATLLELYGVETDALLAPDPGEASTVTQARELLQRIQVAVMKEAETVLDDATDPSGNSVVLEQIAWARRAAESPRVTALTLFRLLLADQPEAATVTAILGATDTQIQTGVGRMVPRLAKGMLVNR